MAVGLLLILIVGVLGIAVVGAIVLRRRRLQFSLRTLLVVCALVAMGFSAWYSWRWWTLARVTWVDPASPEARRILSEPSIVENDGKFQAAFRPRYRSVGSVLNAAGRVNLEGGGSMRTNVSADGQIDLESDGRDHLERYLAALRQADVPKPGMRVIHGRVEDRSGNPVAGAIVDLLGPYVYINHFQTRPDGTFAMPIEAPPRSGYRLRIRYAGGTERMETPSFSLADDPAEVMVIVRVR